MLKYRYGEKIKYKFVLLENCDEQKLKIFDCRNKKLNGFIQNDIICGYQIVNEKGLIFKVEDEKQMIS